MFPPQTNICNILKKRYKNELSDVRNTSLITASATLLGICTDGTPTEVLIGKGSDVGLEGLECPTGEKLESIIYGAIPIKWQFDTLPEHIRRKSDFILKDKDTMKAYEHAGIFPSKTMFDVAWIRQIDNVCSLNMELETLSCTGVTFDNYNNMIKHQQELRQHLFKLDYKSIYKSVNKFMKG